MRPCMFILAVCGILSGPSAQGADDPFDFSSPLRVSDGRSAKYYGNPKEDTPPAAAPTDVSAYRRTARPDQGAPSVAPQSRPDSVNFSQEIARQRQPTTQRDPQETLRRFDEFIKSREVVPAEYRQTTGASRDSQIQRVQFEEDLPSFGTLEEQPQETLPAQSRDSFASERMPADAGQRLVEPISTSPFESADAGRRDDDAFQPDASARLPENPVPREQSLRVGNFGTISAPGTTSQVNRNSDKTMSPPAITCSWKLIDPLNLGQECRAELTLTNQGETDADKVSLEIRVPSSVQVINASPAPVEDRAFLGWKLSGLAGGASEVIEVTLVANQSGALDLATFVRHTTASAETLTVSEPKLELAITGPAEVNVGEPASQTLVVRNPGTGIATNVMIEAQIPTGLQHATGELLQMDMGSLHPGETRSARLVMGAVSGGVQIIQVEATAGAGIVKTASAEVNVIAPSLRAAIAGPSLRYLGREANYTVRVLNDGSSATDFVQVNQRIPEGFKFVQADRGAKFDPSTRLLNWYVGRLESGETQDLTVALLPTVAGDFVHEVRATSDLGAEADAQISTKVQGTASLVVEVADLDDPVEVGSQTAYEIKVTNEGTASAKSVALTCELPPGLSFLNAEGSSEHRLQDGVVGFRPIEELAAGKSLTFRVFVQGGRAGDQRFRCRLVSESLTEPLFTEELTKFYGE